MSLYCYNDEQFAFVSNSRVPSFDVRNLENFLVLISNKTFLLFDSVLNNTPFLVLLFLEVVPPPSLASFVALVTGTPERSLGVVVVVIGLLISTFFCDELVAQKKHNDHNFTIIYTTAIKHTPPSPPARMNQEEVFHVHQRVKIVGRDDEYGTVERIEGNKLKVKPDDPLKKWNLRSKDHFTAAFIDSITASAATLVPPLLPTSDGKPKSEGTIDRPKTTRKPKYEETTTTLLPTPPPVLATLGTSIVEGIDRDWNSSKDVYFPPCFTNKSVKEIPKIDAATGTVEWNGKSFTTSAWLEQLHVWEISFPNIKDPVTKSTRWEKPTDKHTTRECNIDYCWNSMDQRTLPSRWKDIFRVDMWGNVVSIRASNNSLTKFDVDHAFPWSRGTICRQHKPSI